MPIASRLAPLLDGKALGARLRAGRPTPLRASRVALAIGLVVLVALAQVHLRLQILSGGYALSRESRLRHELEDQNQKLRLELATRRDPAVIERRARAELRMAPPDPAAIRTVRAPSTVAAAATRPAPVPETSARAPEPRP